MHDNLKKTYEYLKLQGYNPYYLAVYGSQNYGLDVNTEEYKSDIDYKCIIIPTLAELVRNSKPFAKVIDFDGGQIDIKDIRAYTESVVKCNVNFLEILKTEYYIGNDFFREYLTPLMAEMGQFYIKACYGMMLEKYEALRHPYPSTIGKIEKFGYDPKQLHHIVRLYLLIKRYTEGEFPEFKHRGIEARDLIDIKIGKIPNDEVDKMATDFLSMAKELRESYNIQPKFETKQKIIEKSYSIIHTEICNSIKYNHPLENSLLLSQKFI